MTESIRTRLRADIPAAMKARDALRVSVLRTTLAAIENAEAVDATCSRPASGLHANDVARRHLVEHEVLAIVHSMRAELHAAAVEMRGIGRHELAEEKLHQADVLDAYLGS